MYSEVRLCAQLFLFDLSAAKSNKEGRAILALKAVLLQKLNTYEVFEYILKNKAEKPFTVPTIWESKRPVLCSKLPFFKTSWQILEMPLELSLPFSSLPYLRALKWGTIWPYTSRGIKNTSSQSWKFNFYLVNLDFSTLTCCIFDTLWGIGSYSTSFESSQMWYRSD